jgi:Phage Mu protein F like protein
MSYVLYDSRGYVADGPSINGLAALAAWASSHAVLSAFFVDGHTTQIAALIDALEKTPAEGSVESSKVALLGAARRAHDVLILSDGVGTTQGPRAAAKVRTPKPLTQAHGVADAARPLIKDMVQKAWSVHGVTDYTSAKAAAERDVKTLGEDLTSLLQRVINASARVHARTWAVPAPRVARGRVLTFLSGVLKALKPRVVMDIEKPQFDVTNSEAVGWARSHAGELIKGMLDERISMIQSIIADGIEKGRTVSQTSKLLQDSVGLSARQGEALLGLQETLEEQGLTSAEIDDEVSVRAQEMTESRAEMIAQTETMAAANEGQKELWDQAVEQGLLSGSESKEWIYTPDNFACQDCEDLDGTTVPLSEEFEDGDPPLHPYCRCTLGLAVEAVE